MKKFYLICLSVIALLCVGCTKNKVDYMEPKTNINNNKTEINNQNELEVESGEALSESEEIVLEEKSRRC